MRPRCKPMSCLTEIRVPAPGGNSRSAYLKFGYLERPSVGVAVALTLNGATVNDVKIAVGCAGPAPKRVAEAEALLTGKSKDEAVASVAAGWGDRRPCLRGDQRSARRAGLQRTYRRRVVETRL